MMPPARIAMRTVILTTLHILALGIMVGAARQANAVQLPDAVTARPQPADCAEFEVVSYLPSLQAIEPFAGADIQAVHDAPRDSEFLMDKETRVKNYRRLVRTIVPQQPTGT
jgi:hypothetical protein